ncbi:ABC transporter permease [Croceiramulus getboli]|nr:ABC transporter permease [Flavobacteriaceae bacterium YJPT1-3]
MIHSRLVLSIAKTHLLSKLKQTVTATLGVAFGIGAYITLVCFMTGLNTMLDDLILNQTPDIQIYNEIKPSEQQPVEKDPTYYGLNQIRSIRPKLSRKQIYNALPLLKNLNRDPDVVVATPQVRSPLFYISGDIQMAGTLTGFRVDDQLNHFNFGDYVVDGNLQSFDKINNGIILGYGIAEKMALRPGDRIQITTSSGGIHAMKIVALYRSGIAELDDVVSFVSLNTAQQVLGEANNYITDIQVRLKNIDQAYAYAQSIEARYEVTAVDINTANAQYETGTTIRNLITYSVSITLLIVAGFGIYNILNMLIYEKMNDIAILRATGFSGKDVQFIFLSQALIIGIVGGLLGLMIGLGLSVLIDNTPFNTSALPTVETYPVNHNPVFYAIGIVFAIGSTCVAGYLPSLRARRIDPVEIIRGR